jgi:hypothetical protein
MANVLPMFQFHWLVRILETPAATGATIGASAPAALGSAKARALGLRLIHGQSPALQSLTVQSSDGSLEVFTFPQLDKAETPRRPRQLVANHHRRRHLKTGVNHEFAELSVADAMRKITYKELRSHSILQLMAVR